MSVVMLVDVVDVSDVVVEELVVVVGVPAQMYSNEANGCAVAGSPGPNMRKLA